MLCIYYFILLFVIFNNKVYSVEVNAIAYSLNGGGTLYSPMISEFNTFSKNNNLNITINLNLISGLNSTSTVNGYEETLESLLNRKSDKYDLIFYDNIYTPRIEPYFLDLNKLIPKEHINIYIPGVITQIGFHNDRLVGFPITIDYTVLYCNEYYLNKYKKEIPKTWDELINTGKYILNEEKKLNNSDFIAYNGFFDYSEQGTCSLYEFIYSCRNSIDSEFPVLTDQITVKALKKIKRNQK
ncbi:hypothetical protein LY90DRAFT_500086 [Neocallimastix californiae]|uniref:Periplasmic binding protein-like II n=1 Tax=Neocallimastix californiae TaxID=1754190 RepID=A0A1Y2FEG2_9FUNG|nr:hypothetical protein LY90DRAFT_500086 [Neocallimastix californiae]|eukprot:ORY81696.1 hypothetical protein LY90DRAFT_500086 [Neocallimastix californiae]